MVPSKCVQQLCLVCRVGSYGSMPCMNAFCNQGWCNAACVVQMHRQAEEDEADVLGPAPVEMEDKASMHLSVRPLLQV